ncbi:MAG: nucleoside deaminase [Minisyncoccia bacterium]|jgi:tRNA(Arg) A34 adenosine deaminase TadA
MNKSDEHFVNIAMEEAKKASWPFGAVVARDGEIIARAGSGDGKDIEIDPTAHAEVNAIRRACVKLNTGNLAGAILYASCEPCALCFGAAWYANIKKIVYGTSIEDIKKINKAWGGDLAFPRDHISKTGIHMRGGILKDEIMKMYVIHPYVINHGEVYRKIKKS